jgi:hypothetical protein
VGSKDGKNLKRILNGSTPLLDYEEIGDSAVIVVLSRFSSLQHMMETHFGVEPVLQFDLWVFGKGPKNYQLITNSRAHGSPWETARVIEQAALDKLKEMQICIEGIKLTMHVVWLSPSRALQTLTFHGMTGRRWERTFYGAARIHCGRRFEELWHPSSLFSPGWHTGRSEVEFDRSCL